MKKIISLGAVLGAVSPLFVFAYNTTLFNIIDTISTMLAIAMPILITIAALWFVWNVIMYAISGDEAKKKVAKDGIIQGLVGLFIIVAFWGIIKIFMTTFRVDTGSGLEMIPEVPLQLVD